MNNVIMVRSVNAILAGPAQGKPAQWAAFYLHVRIPS